MHFVDQSILTSLCGKGDSTSKVNVTSCKLCYVSIKRKNAIYAFHIMNVKTLLLTSFDEHMPSQACESKK